MFTIILLFLQIFLVHSTTEQSPPAGIDQACLDTPIPKTVQIFKNAKLGQSIRILYFQNPSSCCDKPELLLNHQKLLLEKCGKYFQDLNATEIGRLDLFSRPVRVSVRGSIKFQRLENI